MASISTGVSIIRSSHHAVARSISSRNRFVFSKQRPLVAAHFFSTDSGRIQGITVNPNSVATKILPGNKVIKIVRDEERQILAERAFGNFWMMSDLKKTDNKTILTNDTLIAEADAQVFPTLGEWITLEEGSSQQYQQVPDFFIRNNRADDAKAQCTLVAIAFKQFGAKMLGSWTVPFQEAFQGNSRVEVVHLNITEGWFLSKLQGYLTSSARKNTPQEEWPTTLLHYASNTEDPSLATFKDTLRMHNTLTGYVYLLDGLGRVRCAASGAASPEEATRIIDYAKELTPALLQENDKKKNNRRR